VAASLVLASQSPRRRALLRRLGFKFEVVPAEIEELESTNLSLRELTIANATRKGRAVQHQRSKAIVLAADTLISLDGEIIGKPQDLDDARLILRRLSGRVHEVCTSVFIGAPGQQFAIFSEISRVHFRRLDAPAITDYLAKINPLDKAGAYAVQGEGREIIASVEGSFTNVIGLPTERTIAALARFRIYPRL
jgi:septum formation protein